MRIVIVRHGQSVANAQGRWQGQLDYELSVEVHTHAEKLKERFIPGFKVSKILKENVNKSLLRGL